jgi:predicted small lipoprotein YifL
MLRAFQILVSAPRRWLALAVLGAAVLAGCGQKGALFLPTGDAASGRASLPQTLSPAPAPAAPASAPPTGTASPVRTP